MRVGGRVRAGSRRWSGDRSQCRQPRCLPHAAHQPGYCTRVRKRGMLGATRLSPDWPFRSPVPHQSKSSQSAEERSRTVEDGSVGAAEGGDRNHALALDLAITEQLHGGASGGSLRAACTQPGSGKCAALLGSALLRASAGLRRNHSTRRHAQQEADRRRGARWSARRPRPPPRMPRRAPCGTLLRCRVTSYGFPPSFLLPFRLRGALSEQGVLRG